MWEDSTYIFIPCKCLPFFNDLISLCTFKINPYFKLEFSCCNNYIYYSITSDLMVCWHRWSLKSFLIVILCFCSAHVINPLTFFFVGILLRAFHCSDSWGSPEGTMTSFGGDHGTILRVWVTWELGGSDSPSQPLHILTATYWCKKSHFPYL